MIRSIKINSFIIDKINMKVWDYDKKCQRLI